MPEDKIWGKYSFQARLNSKSADPTKYCLMLYVSTNNGNIRILNHELVRILYYCNKDYEECLITVVTIANWQSFTDLGERKSEVKAEVLINCKNELNGFRKMKQGLMKSMEESLKFLLTRSVL